MEYHGHTTVFKHVLLIKDQFLLLRMDCNIVRAILAGGEGGGGGGRGGGGWGGDDLSK